MTILMIDETRFGVVRHTIYDAFGVTGKKLRHGQPATRSFAERMDAPYD